MPSFSADVVAQNREGLIPNSTKSCIGLNSAMRNRAVTVFSHRAVSCTANDLLLMHSSFGILQNQGEGRGRYPHENELHAQQIERSHKQM